MKLRIPQSLPVWQVYLPLLVLANLAFFTHSLIGGILTLAFFVFAPGYLLLKSLRPRDTLSPGSLSLSIGLSIALVTMVGLALNTVHYMGLSRPLRVVNIFGVLDALVLLLLFFNRSNKLSPNFKMPHFGIEEKVFITIFSLFPFLAVGGAFRLNNGASNILTMILMGLISITFIVLMLRPKMPRIYPYLLFMTALSILLCLSLRGWNITGHDIHHEFSVFNTTMKIAYWRSITPTRDPYNACLSITLLPTILQKISGIDPVYIFKVVFQVIFAAVIPALYFFMRRFANEKMALLGVFAFITFPTFANDMPFLNRQEIAFCYFILLLYVNFTTYLTNRAKTILTVIFLLSMIFAHYSSSYATIGLLFCTYALYHILSTIFKNKEKIKIPLLRLPVLIMAFLASFVWNAQLTASTNNLSSTVTSAIRGFLSKNPEASSFGKYNLLSQSAPKTPETQFEQIADRKKSDAEFVPAEVMPLTSLGRALSHVVDVAALNIKVHASIAKILQLLVVVGTIILFFQCLRKSHPPRKTYFLAFSMSAIGALVLFTFMPELSIGYDVTRLFQQSMMFLWLPVILCASMLFAWLGKYKLAGVAALLVFMYTNLVGFAPQLTGGYLPQLALNNSGVYYDYFYIHKSDLVGTDWLTNNRTKYLNVFIDSAANLPPRPFSFATGLGSGYPQGYYYQDHTNTTRGVYRAFVTSGFAEYTNPAFVANKDLVYSNGTSEIYYRLGNPPK